jgi:hypothetical protein
VRKAHTAKAIEGGEALFVLLDAQRLDGALALGVSEGTDHAADEVVESSIGRDRDSWWWEQHACHLLMVESGHGSAPVLALIQATEGCKDVELQVTTHVDGRWLGAGHEVVDSERSGTGLTLALLQLARSRSRGSKCHWLEVVVDGIGRYMDECRLLIMHVIC